jgi:hypothetical protein
MNLHRLLAWHHISMKLNTLLAISDTRSCVLAAPVAMEDQPWPQMSSSCGQVESRTGRRAETRSNGMVFSLDDRRHFGYGFTCLPTASPFDGSI